MPPVNRWIAPSRSNGSRRYRSRSHVRSLASDGKWFSHRTPGHVSPFYFIRPVLTQTALVQKVVQWKPQIASCSHRSRHPPRLCPHQRPRYYLVCRVCHVIHPFSDHVIHHVTFRTSLQDKVTSWWCHPKKAPESPKEPKFCQNSRKSWFLFIFIWGIAETMHAYYVQFTISTPVFHPSVFMLQTRLPQLSMQPHFVPSACKTCIYSIVTHKPCFYEISLLQSPEELNLSKRNYYL